MNRSQRVFSRTVSARLMVVLMVVLTVFLAVMLCGAVLGAREVPYAAAVVDSEIPGVRGLAAGDVDGDGDFDLFAAATGAVNLLWVENTVGDGSAWSKHTIDTSFDAAVSVAAGDVDGDGDVDVVGAANADHDITWWENSAGDGSAWTRHDIDTAYTGASAVALADVDRDGHLDVLAVGALNGEVTWFENSSGDGSTWAENTLTTSWTGARAVFGADLDGDGDTDLLTTGDLDEVAWWENTNGVGTGWSEQTIDGAFLDGSGVAAGDVDGDGDLDVVASSEGDDKIIWYENGGIALDAFQKALSWTPRTIDGSFDGAAGVFVGDLDDDGDLDVLGVAHLDNDLSWWENLDGSGLSFTERSVAGDFGGTRFASAADLDDDGDLDLFASSVDLEEVSWWQNETIHRSATHPVEDVLTDAFTGSYAVAAGDLDGDGDNDLVAVACPGVDVNSCGGGQIAWWENTVGDASSFTKHALPDVVSGPVSVEIHDIDGDGDQDLLTFEDGSNEASWWENDGTGSFTESVIRTLPFNRVTSADLDGDGDPDLLTSSKTNKAIDWFSNDGSGGTWTFTNIASSFDDVRSVAGGDIDGDGDMDVVTMVLALGDADPVDWWENEDGVGQTWSAPKSIDADWNGAFFVATADMDGDGDTDVIGAADGSPDILSWFENELGDGSSWSTHDISCAACLERINQPRFVLAADLDSDGDNDIVGTGWKDGGRLDWYENVNGDGLTWALHIVTDAFDGARWAAAADLDHDGDVDLVATAQTDGDLSYWPNRGGQFALPTLDLGASLGNGVTEAVLRITAGHRGRVGDPDVELTALELLFEEAVGVPLTTAEANGLFDSLSIYRDDGDESFDAMTDTEVTTVGTLSLSAGIQTVAFTDGDASVQVPVGTPVDFFVVLSTAADFTSQPVQNLFVTHITEASSSADDADHDLDLDLEFFADVTSGPISVNPGAPSVTADLEVNLADSLDPVATGATYSYTLSVTNNGPDPAENVQLTTTLKGSATFGDTTGCAEDPGGTPTCSLGTLAALETVMVTVEALASSDTPGTAIAETTVSTSTVSTVPANDTAMETTTVEEPTPMADLEVRLGVSPTHFTPGTEVTWFLEVRNLGPDAATGAAADDLFPEEVTGIDWTCTGSGGALCNNASGTGDLVNQLVNLPAGSTARFVATATVTGDSDFNNTASTTVPGGTIDPNPANNSATAESIAVEELRFVGDFEEGDLSDWSAAIGGGP